MQTYLGFVLYAPMASFGAVAVGEQRPGWDRPGHSALVGLLGAALGIDRADEPGQLALASGYGFAVQTDSPGTPLVDYHTAQVPPKRRGRRYATRAEELADPPLETVLTWREYRTDALHTVVLWARDAAPHPLEHLATALAAPAYTLMLGRKSCPLGLPLWPRIIEAADPLSALAIRVADAPGPERVVRQMVSPAQGTAYPIVALDAADSAGMEGQASTLRVERRRDAVTSRARWQFGLRNEAIIRKAPP
jgi:CRISPR system Cascade subunit CasD